MLTCSAGRSITGFLPVLYSLLQAHFTPPVQLPPDSVDHPANAQSTGPKLKSQPLRGYKVLLLWLPAACDLTGTTVRHLHLHFQSSLCCLPTIYADVSPTVYPVDDCRASLYARVHISDDSRRTRSFRRSSQRNFLAPPPLDLPVRGQFRLNFMLLTTFYICCSD